jgi:FAD/FMN-containing dehydrogenase
VLRAYRLLTLEAPRELTAFLILARASAAPFVPVQWHDERICMMAICYSGELDRAEQALAPLRALREPIVDILRAQPYAELQSYLDESEPRGDHYYWKTEYTSELSDELLGTVRDLAGTCPIPRAEVAFLHLGGALNERDDDDGAVGNRDARYACGAIGMWDAGDPLADDHRRWVREAWGRFRPFSTGGNYINFQTADEGEDRIRETYGANFDRLLEIKRAYDPQNLFRVNRNIAT